MAGGKRWQYTYKGEVYSESQLTMGQAEKIEDLLGLSWLQISPLASAKQARVVLAVMAAERSGGAVEEILGDIAAMDIVGFLTECIDMVDDDVAEIWADGNPQMGAGELSTPTS